MKTFDQNDEKRLESLKQRNDDEKRVEALQLQIELTIKIIETKKQGEATIARLSECNEGLQLLTDTFGDQHVTIEMLRDQLNTLQKRADQIQQEIAQIETQSRELEVLTQNLSDEEKEELSALEKNAIIKNFIADANLSINFIMAEARRAPPYETENPSYRLHTLREHVNLYEQQADQLSDSPDEETKAKIYQIFRAIKGPSHAKSKTRPLKPKLEIPLIQNHIDEVNQQHTNLEEMIAQVQTGAIQNTTLDEEAQNTIIDHLNKLKTNLDHVKSHYQQKIDDLDKFDSDEQYSKTAAQLNERLKVALETIFKKLNITNESVHNFL